MELDHEKIEEFRALEESLWQSKTRFDLSYQEKVFAPDFFEFGRSGRIYSRQELIRDGGSEIKAKIPLKNFKVRALNDTTIQITYVSEVEYQSLEEANRSSIWSKTSNGWKLRFHQGTPTNSTAE